MAHSRPLSVWLSSQDRCSLLGLELEIVALACRVAEHEHFQCLHRWSAAPAGVKNHCCAELEQLGLRPGLRPR